MDIKRICVKIIKVTGCVCTGAFGTIVLIAVIIHVTNPNYYGDLSINQNDHALYWSIEFGPFEKTFKIENTGFDFGQQTLRLSPDKRWAAYAVLTSDPGQITGHLWHVKIINLLTLKKKTIVTSLPWGNFYWIDNKTILFSVPHWTDTSYYKYINIRSKGEVVFTREMDNTEIINGWDSIPLDEMILLENKLEEKSNLF